MLIGALIARKLSLNGKISYQNTITKRLMDTELNV
jgi:hypothetical protein